MFATLFENYPFFEVIARRTATSCAPIKKTLKRLLKKKKIAGSVVTRNEELIGNFKNTLLSSGISHGDIVIIHSSMDGLNKMGIEAEEILQIIKDTFEGCTVVFATFPIESSKKKEIYTYNPAKTLAWTGVLPNLFLKQDGVVRSRFPYNSLAAYGSHAEEMVANDLDSYRPHDKSSAWYYCMSNHAKILFLGTTSRESNTMAIHMVPDIMGDEWPVNNWYSTRSYKIKLADNEIKKEIQYQDEYWYRYVNEYHTDKILRDNSLLRTLSDGEITVEIVDDSKKMFEFLMDRCKRGLLMYSIPKRYRKK